MPDIIRQRREPPGKRKVRLAIDQLGHLVKNYRTGETMHKHLGHVEVECESCYGTGQIETERENRPWAVELRECPDCRGWGTVWKARDE